MLSSTFLPLSALLLAVPSIAKPIWLRDVPANVPASALNLSSSTPSGSYFAFGTAPNSFKSNLSSIVVFGDSLSDNGSNGVYKLSGGLAPSPKGYPNGTLSNGRVYPSYMAERLGLPLVDFAIGGATTFDIPGNDLKVLNYFTNVTSPILSTVDQINAYVNVTAGSTTDIASALHIVFSGGNDLLGGYGITGLQTAQAIQGGVDSLIAAGAERILVINLLAINPTLLLPAFSGDSTTPAEHFAAQYTNVLHSSLDELLLIPKYDEHVAISDLWSASQVIASAPAQFGFDPEKLDQSCQEKTVDAKGQTNYTICADVNEHFFWDEVHPTTRGHSILAGLNLATLLRKGWASNA